MISDGGAPGRRLHDPGVGLQRRVERPAVHAARRDDAAAGSASCVPRSFTGTGTVGAHAASRRPRARRRPRSTRSSSSTTSSSATSTAPPARATVTKLNAGGDARRLRDRRLPGGGRARRRERERRGTALHGVERVPVRPDARRTPPSRRSAACSTACARRIRTSSTSCSSAATTLLPFARLDDLTTVSTENGYASTFPASQRARRLARGGEDALRRPVRRRPRRSRS